MWDTLQYWGKWITDVAGGLVIIFALVILVYWLLLSRQKKLRFNNFILWSPAATKDVARMKCRIIRDKEETVNGITKKPELDAAVELPPFHSNDKIWLKMPAVTVRGQIVNPWFWPLIIQEAEFTIKLVAVRTLEDSYAQPPEPCGWDGAVWNPSYFGATFPKTEPDKTSGLARFCLRLSDTFAPIVVQPRSELDYEIILLPREFLRDRAKKLYEYMGGGPAPAVDHWWAVGATWKPGIYKCRLKLKTMGRWGDQTIVFFHKLVDTQIEEAPDGWNKILWTGVGYSRRR